MSRSSAIDLLAELRDRGIELAVEGDALRYRPIEVVDAALRARMVHEKAELIALLAPSEAPARASVEPSEPPEFEDHGEDAAPLPSRCRRCRERDFVRPRAGGAWRCARCRPYELPASAVEWLPAVTLTVPLEDVLAAAEGQISHWDSRRRPCWCCGARSAWRLRARVGRAPGLWGCARCHPPIPAPEEIETLVVTREAP